MATFQDKLKELRKEKGITLDKMAKDLGTTKSTLSRYENGKREPKMFLIKKIANYFNVSVDYLLGRTDQRNPDVGLPEGVKELLNDEEQAFIIDLIQKDQIQVFLREARGASDEDLATAIRVFKAVKEGKETGDKL